jgi:hypothetical protein
MESVQAMRRWYLASHKRISEPERPARAPDGFARLGYHSLVATVRLKANIRFGVDQPVAGGVAIGKRTPRFECTAASF